VGDDLDFILPEFSESKVITVQPNIVRLPKIVPQTAYNLIVGVETLTKVGAILDFNSMEITVLGHKLPMHTFSSLKDTKKLHNSFREYLESSTTREATNSAVEILDANYEKADLPKIIYETCKHLTVHQNTY